MGLPPGDTKEQPLRAVIAVPEAAGTPYAAEDVGIDDAIERACTVDAGGFKLRLASPADLVVLKLAAAEEPTSRTSKRRQDLMDVLALADDHAEIGAAVPDLAARVERLAAHLVVVDRPRS